MPISPKPNFKDLSKVSNNYMTIDQVAEILNTKPTYTDDDSELAIKISRNPPLCELLEPVVISNNTIQYGNELVSAIFYLQDKIDPCNPAWHNIKLKVCITDYENILQ